MKSLPARLWKKLRTEFDRTRKGDVRTYSRTLDCMQFEPRLLFSVTPMAAEVLAAAGGEGQETSAPTIAESEQSAPSVMVDDAEADSSGTPAADDSSTSLSATVSSDLAVRRELVIVDASISNIDQLLDDLQANADASRRFEVVRIDFQGDGVEQITELLAEYENLSAIHLLTHATDGAFRLGDTTVTDANFDEYSAQISQWRNSLTGDADLLFYGCELAAGERGEALVTRFAQQTGADVAASTDNTGHSMFGGDWNLEYTSGNIETVIPFSSTAQSQWVNLLNVAVDNASSAIGNDQGLVTISHMTSGTDRLMLVGISIDPHGDVITSVTYNGVSLSLIGAHEEPGSHSRVEIWALIAPQNGNHDVEVSLSGNGYHGAIIGVMTFTGVDQTTPLENFTTAFGNSTSPSATIASQAGDLVFGVVHVHATGGVVPGAGQTEYWDLDESPSAGGGTVSAGAASVTTSWTTGSDDWTVGAVSIRSAATNTAPTLDATASPMLNNVSEDAGAPSGAVGTLISSLIDFSTPGGQLDNVTDPDSGALLGVAVTAADTTNGSWWYSTDNGSNWSSLGAVADNNARLLSADANTRIYFQPSAGYNGTIANAITFRAWDGTTGANGSLADTSTNGGVTAYSTATDTASLTVAAVNDAPVNTVPGAQSIAEDGTLVFSSGNGNQIGIADVDADGGSVQVTLTGTNGAITLSGIAGLSFSTGDGTADATMTFTGTVVNINAALNGLGFTPTSDYSGAAQLQIVTNDQGNTGSGGAQSDTDNIAITITAVNDVPAATITPASYSVNEQATLTLHGTGLSIDDIDAGSSSVQATLSVVSGTLSAAAGTTGVTVGGSGTNTVTLTGTLTQINNLLAGNNGGTISYTVNSDTPPASDTLTLEASDLGNTGSGGTLTASDTATINVTALNDAPTATITPASYSVNEQATLTLHGTGLSISDVDAAAASVQATLSVVSGTIVVGAGTTGVGVGGSGTDTITLTGTLTQINNLLAGNNGGTLTYTINSDTPPASDTLTLQASDLGNTGSGGTLTASDTATINVTALNDAPTATIIPVSYSVNEQATLTLHGTGLSIADVDAAATSVQATLSVVSGTITAGAGTTGVGVAGSGTDTITLTGTLTQINNLLAGNNGGTLTYTINSDTPPASDTLTLQASDLGNTGSGGTLTASDTATINITALNDAPTNTIPGAQSVAEDGTLVFSSGNGNQISVADLDAGGGSVQVSLTGTNGTITLASIAGLSFSVGDGTADATTTFSGTVAAINTALDGLTFAPTADYNGAAQLQIVTDDQGNVGSGGALSDTDIVAITVDAVNDAPLVSVPSTQTTAFQQSVELSTAQGTFISLSDVDAGSGNLQLTLVADNGTITLAQTAGLTFLVGTGTADTTLTVQASASDLNAALDGLVFTPSSTFRGTASIDLTVDDLGNTGSGGALQASSQVVIDVANAPQRLLFSGPSSVAADNFFAVFSTSSGNALVFTDVYAENPILTVTLGATNGTFRLAGTDGLTFLSGGSSGTSMSFTGALSDVNVALDGSTFTSNSSDAMLSIESQDPPRDGGGSHSINSTILVNQPPVFPAVTPVEQQIEEILEEIEELLGIPEIAPPLELAPKSDEALVGQRIAKHVDVQLSAPFAEVREFEHFIVRLDRHEDDLPATLPIDQYVSQKDQQRQKLANSAAAKYGTLDTTLPWPRISIMTKAPVSNSLEQTLVAGSAGVAVTLSVGYVVWSLRAASLLSTFLASMPAWQAFDPLPILNCADRNGGASDEADDDDASLGLFESAKGAR